MRCRTAEKLCVTRPRRSCNPAVHHPERPLSGEAHVGTGHALMPEESAMGSAKTVVPIGMTNDSCSP